jgi:hypothetical protein
MQVALKVGRRVANRGNKQGGKTTGASTCASENTRRYDSTQSPSYVYIDLVKSISVEQGGGRVVNVYARPVSPE